MGPHWQGTSHSAPATGHEIDCSYTNAEWTNNGCVVSIYTITSGANCYFEIISSPTSGTSGASYYPNTQCQIHLDGLATWKTDSTGSCAYSLSLQASWTSGVNSTLFNGSAYSTRSVMTHASGGTYHLAVTADVGNLPQHTLHMMDHFVVNFPTAGCPRTVQGGIRGNVYDPAADAVTSGTAGYFQDSIAAA
ncbi:MAG: hypothetical protein QOC82_1837 [Frankiaceae bacterium]|nr:hypothetical protein [Frankiaceae bacterium]